MLQRKQSNEPNKTFDIMPDVAMRLSRVITPDSKFHGANMGPTWVVSAPDGPHVGPMNLAIRERLHSTLQWWHMRHHASQINSNSNIFSTVESDWQQEKYQNSGVINEFSSKRVTNAECQDVIYNCWIIVGPDEQRHAALWGRTLPH